MIDVAAQHPQKLFLEEAVDDGAVHDASSDDDHLGRQQQSYIQTELR